VYLPLLTEVNDKPRAHRLAQSVRIELSASPAFRPAAVENIS